MNSTQDLQTTEAQQASAARLSHSEAIQLFSDFINARPGLDPHNYTSRSQINSEYRRIAQQKNRALRALGEFASLPYKPELLGDALRNCFSGRLLLNDNGKLSYTAGQYEPVEYRLAAAVVLEYYNQNARPKPQLEESPELDALYRQMRDMAFDDDNNLRAELVPDAPYYVYGLDQTFKDWVFVPALNRSEIDAIAEYMRYRGDVKRIDYCRTDDPIRNLKPRKLMLSWRYHAHDVQTPR